MPTVDTLEASLIESNNILIALSELADESLFADFFGSVIQLGAAHASLPNLSQKTIYLCGDISRAKEIDIGAAARVFVIRELSSNFNAENGENHAVVDLGQVPIRVHGVGVYFRRFFDSQSDFFKRICAEHTFQTLTESTKPAKAHRTGIYLTSVTPKGDDLHFHLLRCSTNLAGPSENFRATDRHIVDSLNHEASYLFRDYAPLNHVLAQIYPNTPGNAEQKPTKAKISAHADKTKDMPRNGIMAFCTFYEQLEKLQPLPNDPFDYGYKGKSGLTRLHFRLKAPTPGPYPAQFTVTLYPNSVFFMPLSTNRLYTHEIQSSILDAHMLPTRLGYVVRCSSTEAVFSEGQTFLEKNEKRIPLEPPTLDGMQKLRHLYAEENRTQDFIDYGDQFLFSMNQGDYLAPVYSMADEFRVYSVPPGDEHFDELRDAIRFENVGKGRQGTVLVKPDDQGLVPIVRTTTPYAAAAQCFRSAHDRLARKIQKAAAISRGFNNALMEVYSNSYTSMGAHSDQALDLDDDSFIALFSAYKYPDRTRTIRKLVVEPKAASGESFEIPLVHNSVVVFSVAANRRFRHKIVLEKNSQTPENEWLGITYRTSKTFVRIEGEEVNLRDGSYLTLANEEQRREFFELRRRENQEVDFKYPPLTYTLSASDRMRPER